MTEEEFLLREMRAAKEVIKEAQERLDVLEKLLERIPLCLAGNTPGKRFNVACLYREGHSGGHTYMPLFDVVPELNDVQQP